MAIVYIIGVHGSGKTTVIERLRNEGFPSLRRLDLQLSDHGPFERAMIRVVNYFLQYKRDLIVQAEDLKSVWVGDRCICDTLAYALAYRSLGWINKDEHLTIRDTAKSLFSEIDFPESVVLLSPSRERVIANLTKRWRLSGKRWREDNFEYLDAVMQSYKRILEDDLKVVIPSVTVVEDNDIDSIVRCVRSRLENESQRSC